jgi:protein-L-isoaspartate O-methyltransferase
MIIPVGGNLTQELILIRKKEGRLFQESVAPVRFVPMVQDR